jgi:hypothetical protein
LEGFGKDLQLTKKVIGSRNSLIFLEVNKLDGRAAVCYLDSGLFIGVQDGEIKREKRRR